MSFPRLCDFCRSAPEDHDPKGCATAVEWWTPYGHQVHDCDCHCFDPTAVLL